MKNKLNQNIVNNQKELPIKVIQFGGGNFMRAFTDYVIDKLNKDANFNAGIANIKVTPSGSSFYTFEEQDNLYTLFIRGLKKGEIVDEKTIISSIQKSINPYEDYQDFLALAQENELQFLFSNTTESGIVFDELEDDLDKGPHKNFPAKVTTFLYKRFQYFNGDKDKGLTIIPCELIDKNADTLKKYILQYAELWNLEPNFSNWINTSNSFHNTLVDRIVPGYPKDDKQYYESQLDYNDELMVVSEAFLLWAIEGDETLLEKIPFNQANEQILIVKDLQPYRTSKVRILNGVHTAMVAFSIMLNQDTVKNAIDNNTINSFVNKLVYNEIIPILDLPEDELKTYAEDVFDRFKNPFLKHHLSSIALNSISKFKVRVLPSLLDYVDKFDKLPANITFSLACLIRFYKGNWQNKNLPTNDDKAILDEFKSIWENNDYNIIAKLALENTSFWDQDLTEVANLQTEIAKILQLIDTTNLADAYTKYTSN